MKNIRNVARCAIAISMCLSTSLPATYFVQGNGSLAPFTFTSVINTAVFDQANGTLYVGIATPDSGTTPYIISKASRFYDTPSFSGITPVGFRGTGVAFLALPTAQGVPSVNIAAVQTQTATLGAITVYAFPVDNSVAPVSIPSGLLDASGGLNANGQTTAGIAALSANEDFIFAAVAANGATTFGTFNGGIAVVSLDFSISATGGLSGLTQTAAVPGDEGIKAQRFDAGSSLGTPLVPQLYITNPGTMAITDPSLYWDDPLQRLYMATTVGSSNLINSGARSVVVGRIDDPGELVLINSAPDGAISSSTSAAQNEIIAGKLSAGGTNFILTVSAVRVMHASTGPSYLIVNGGNGGNSTTGVNTGNLLFALPLVDTRDEDDDITNEATQGTLANKNSALSNGRYTIAASAPGDLVQYPSTSAVDIAAIVGGAPMPILPVQNPSEIVVIDDTVYVTFNIPQNSSNDAGILYSQAKFDATGKVVGWTPWSKRAFPFFGIPGTMNPERIFKFAVDAVTGNVWGLGGDADKTVTVTQWDRGSNELSLAKQLNTSLPKGCYSVLDLDAFTRGFGGATASRYALFGGTNKVVFAQISQNYPANGTSNILASGQTAPQIVMEDFSEPENYIETDLFSTGNVTSLEYARTTAANTQYFFAGTENGLFVFANPDGSGLSANSFGNLNGSPFTSGRWRKAPNIGGSITAVKTLGNTLYVLAFTTSKTQPYSSTIYSIPFTTSVDTMFVPGNINTIAQTGVDAFASILYFSSMQLVATNATGTTEQLILTTNAGLFGSAAPGGLQGVTTQAGAIWAKVVSTDTTMYSNMSGMDPALVSVTTPAVYTTGTPSTVWPISVQDATDRKTFDRSSISQVSGTTNTGTFSFDPSDFNGNGENPALTTLPPTTQFFTDGARRFFVINKAINRLMLAPYNDVVWAVTNPAQNILSNPTLNAIRSIFWVKTIGASGITMAGTNNGVVALE